MKSFASNPRKITERSLRRLRDSLATLGDISGIVENIADESIAPLTHGQVVGGHQRLRAMMTTDIFQSMAKIKKIMSGSDPGATLAAADRLLRQWGVIAKLYGLYTPKKMEVEQKTKYTVTWGDFADEDNGDDRGGTSAPAAAPE